MCQILIFFLSVTYLLKISVQSNIFFDRAVNIPLNSEPTVAYEKQYNLLANETWLLSVRNFPPDKNFGILQVHSYGYNVTLSYTSKMTLKSSINGTNIGLNIYEDDDLYLKNAGPFSNLSILIIVTVYDEAAPIPGNCNMELETEQAPYLRTVDTHVVHKVEAAPASAPNSICGVKKIKYDWYHYFLPSRDHSEVTYFQYLKDMLTVDEIKKNGILSAERPGPAVTRLYSMITGSGVIYTVIASIENTSYQAAYVPSLTYSCSIMFYDNSCDVLQTTLSKVLCFMVSFVGLVLCLFGYKFKTLLAYITGSIFIGLMAYILSVASHLSNEACLWIAFAAAMSGVIMVTCCQNLGYALAVLCSGLLFGFITASYVVFNIPDYYQLVQSDIGYYIAMASIIILVGVPYCSIFQYGFEYCSAIIGAILLTLPFDYYFGGHFQYVVINAIHRMISSDLKYAVVTSPFQIIDGVTSVARLLSALFGVWFQVRASSGTNRERGRNYPSKSTRLLNDSNRSYGSDEVFFNNS